MEEKRVIIAVAVALALVLAWSYLFGPKPKPQEATGPSAASQPVSASAPVAAGPPANHVAAPASAAVTAAPVSRGVEVQPSLRVDGVADVKLSSYGGALAQYSLLYRRYTEKVDGKEVPIDLARVSKADERPLRIGFENPSFRYDATPDYQVSRNGAEQVTFTQDRPDRSDVAVTKRFTFDPRSADGYLFSLDVEVRNVSARALDEELNVYDDGWQNPTNKSSGFMSRYTARPTAGMCYVDDKLESKSDEDLAKKGPLERQGSVRWVAIDYRYFMLALVPHDGPATAGCRARDLGDGTVESTLWFAPQHLAPGQAATYHLGVFAGPKLYGLLKGVTFGAQDPDLGASVQFGAFSFLARPLLFIMRGFYLVARNWGLAIILLTVFIKLITFYWTQKSMVAMREMARLKPKMDELKARYGSDKQRYNQEVMNLYKAHGVNPAAGCLPMLLQMPIWWALYETLESSVELYNAPFGGWIHNLAAPDPYYIVPILMGVLMIAQQRITPTTVDSDQQKIMMYMMPIMFTVFSLMLPSGLSLYIMVNSVLSIAQQAYLNRRHPMPVMARAKK